MTDMIEAEMAKIIANSVRSAEYVENRDMVILMLDREVRKRCEKGGKDAHIDVSMRRLKHLSVAFWFELKDDIKEYGYYAHFSYPRFYVSW
jgi:hypothetical protein